MSDTNKMKIKKYRNWVIGALGLSYLQEGLYPFVDRVVKEEHSRIVQNRTPCANCAIENILPAHASGKVCIQKNERACNCRKRTNKYCATCSKIYDTIVLQHRFRQPQWVTDCSTWYSDHWQFAKCFLKTTTKGSNNTAAETDVSGLLSILINGEFFQSKLQCTVDPPNDIFSQVRQIRNEILHNPTLDLTDNEVTRYLQSMIAVLEDNEALSIDPAAQAAAKKLKETLQGNFVLTTTDESRTIQTALNSIREDREQSEERIRKLEEDSCISLQKLKLESTTEIIAANRGVMEQAFQGNVVLTTTDESRTIQTELNSIIEYREQSEERIRKLEEDSCISLQQLKLVSTTEIIAANRGAMEQTLQGNIVLTTTDESRTIQTALNSIRQDRELEEGSCISLQQLESTTEKNAANEGAMEQGLKATDADIRILEKEWSETENLAKLKMIEEMLKQKKKEEDNWMSCIENDDVKQAQRLLQTGVLPNADQLDKMCHKKVFWRNTDVLIEACNQICKNIQCRIDKSVEDVWPGFLATEIRNDESRQCNFIIVSNEDIDLSEIMYRCVKIPSKPNVISHSKETDHPPLSPRQLNELKQVETIIYEHEQTLMEKHRFLTMISASQYRCSGQTPNVKKTDGLCIVLWVQYKGYVPIDEEPFQKKYGGVAVDVREGSFHPFSGGAEEFQDFLKMGCKISGESEGNNTPQGTLGGFIEHPKYGYCGITSAHCVLPPTEMKRLSKNGELKAEYPFPLNNDDEIAYNGNVYQPDQSGGKVGSLVKAVCHKGNEQTNNVGVDLAVFRLCDRFPKSAEFPFDKNGDTLNYISGKTVGFPRPMANDEELIKFGMTTGLTRGKLESEIALLSVRQDLKWKYSRSQPKFRIHLNHQLEFNSINEQPFAASGDSGALVFSHGHNGKDLLCVGMVVGKKNDETEKKGSFVVTPITAILKELDVTGFKNFESGKLQADVEEIRADVKETRTEVKETRAEIKEIKEMLTRLSIRNCQD